MGFLQPLVPTDTTESALHVEALDEEAEAHDCGRREDGTCDGGEMSDSEPWVCPGQRRRLENASVSCVPAQERGQPHACPAGWESTAHVKHLE